MTRLISNDFLRKICSFFFFKGTFRSPPTSGASRVEDVAFRYRCVQVQLCPADGDTVQISENTVRNVTGADEAPVLQHTNMFSPYVWRRQPVL